MGLILYVAIVLWLDISYIFSLLYQFNINASSKYLYKTDRVLKYLTYTQEYTIKYLLYNSNKSSFIVISNASFIDNPITRRST